MKMKLIRTCEACPEQYDAFYKNELVGYLRLRHGTFTVSCPDVGGSPVYMTNTRGDGSFWDEEEREKELKRACSAIKQWVSSRAQGEYVF